MSVVRSVTGLSRSGLREWVPVALRAVVALVLAPAGLLKFVAYESEAAAFAAYGVPAADVVVLVVGAIEVVAALAVLLGVATRLAALVVVPVMVAAMALYAVVPSNAAVLLGCVGLLALGPGKYALWRVDGAVGLPARATESDG